VTGCFGILALTWRWSASIAKRNINKTISYGPQRSVSGTQDGAQFPIFS
jgi:hypothetical protein